MQERVCHRYCWILSLVRKCDNYSTKLSPYTVLLCIAVNCLNPSTPGNGSLGNYTHTREGATVTYQCNDGFRPSQQMTSYCLRTGNWTPPPELHVCTLVTGEFPTESGLKCQPCDILFISASVDIIPLERFVFREDIECPDDIIPYNCSIISNSETVHLTWVIMAPGQIPINITYNNISDIRDSLNDYISSSVTAFRTDEFIHSTLEITVHPYISTDQIVLMCSIDDLRNDSIAVLVNTSSESSHQLN